MSLVTSSTEQPRMSSQITCRGCMRQVHEAGARGRCKGRRRQAQAQALVQGASAGQGAESGRAQDLVGAREVGELHGVAARRVGVLHLCEVIVRALHLRSARTA